MVSIPLKNITVVRLDHFPRDRGENQKIFELPPPSNSSPLKMDGWKMIVSFWDGLLSGAFAVSFRESIYVC